MITSFFVPFLLTAFLIELTPGPNMAWLALTAASAGKRAAFAATAGIAVGLTIVAIVTAFGLAELVQSSPGLLVILRIGGVAYLLWLAWNAWHGGHDVSPGYARDGEARQWFRHGLLLNLLNPKAALFFIAILPNYIDAGAPIMGQTLLLSLCYVGIATVVHLGLAVLAGTAHRWFASGTKTVLLRRLCAVSIGAVALWFLLGTKM